MSVQAVQRNGPARRVERRVGVAVDNMNTRTASVTREANAGTLTLASRSVSLDTRPDDLPIVFVVDDDVSVRESLESLIKTAGWLAALFASGQEFLAHPRVTVPCCLLLDVSLPGLSGLELQWQIADRIEMPIIFISGHGDVPMTVQAMKAGALEFLTKPLKGDVLLDAMRGALERSRTAIRVDAEMQAIKNCYKSLTPREREVMALVVAGLLNKQIGGELGICETTVKKHRGQVTRKMKADSLAELVTIAARLGLRLGGQTEDPPKRSSDR